MSQPPQTENELKSVALLALKLGVTAFGGPAAHIAMLRDEVVTRRKWLSEQHFLDMLGITNLIPGPNSTEMVIHVGYERAGWRGLIAAGMLFILPAALITLAFAWFYQQYGTTPQLQSLLYGIKPVVIAVVAQALWNLGKTALKSVPMALVGVLILALYVFGVNEILLLFGGALLAALVANAKGLLNRKDNKLVSALPVGLLKFPVIGSAVAAIVAYSPLTLFLTFLKIGAVLYGSGYVLIAFLRNDFVERLGWLTDQQLLDAVAVGQFTPGPVFTTATFVGYLTGGFLGAALATIGIFLPAFIFVALVNPLVPKLRRSALLAALLDGVNVAAVGLMAGVVLDLAQGALIDWLTVLLAVVAAVLLLRFKVNSTWLIVGGAAIGLLAELL